jgi:hypothetical protein
MSTGETVLGLVSQLITLAEGIERSGGDAKAALRAAVDGLRVVRRGLAEIEADEQARLDALKAADEKPPPASQPSPYSE